MECFLVKYSLAIMEVMAAMAETVVIGEVMVATVVTAVVMAAATGEVTDTTQGFFAYAFLKLPCFFSGSHNSVDQ